MQINITSKKTNRSLTVDYDFGADLDEAIQIHGEQVVFDHYVADGKVVAQAVVRGALNNPETSLEAAAEKFKGWKLGVAAPRAAGATVSKVMKRIADGDASALDEVPEDQLDAVQQRVAAALAKRRGKPGKK